MTDVIVTNFNRRFTGVSSTAAQVVRAMAGRYDQALCGHPLPDCPAPITKRQALKLSRKPARGIMIWHVRRNAEMQLAIFARDVLRLPIKTVFTSAAQRRHSAWPRWLISKMDAVIATSEAAASFVPNTRVVIRHGVDTESFQPVTDRAAAWGRTGFPGRRGIANIGRLRPEKGTDVFVRAMIPLLQADPDLTAVAFGLAQSKDQAFLSGLKAEVAAAGLTERLLFPGEVPAPELAKLLPAFSLLVASPRYEGFGMTVLEAMAAGVPFVATDTGIFAEASDQGRAGRVVAIGDVGAVTAEAAALLSDPAAHAAAALTARTVAVTRFSASREAEAIAQVYEDLWAQGVSS